MRPFLSEDDCLRLHSSLLRLWIERLGGWELHGVHKAIFLTPLDADKRGHDLIVDVPASLAVETQQGRDLGERLSHALHRKWKEGFRKLVFIGTDSPDLGTEDLQAAFGALDEAGVVLGPTRDGGYYLIGFSTPLPAVFSNISWGTSEVFDQTVLRLKESSIRWQCLRESFDLDTYEDLVNFHHLLKASPSLPPGPAEEELAALVARLVTSS
jgi:rSAM/selenodomain-associated transferase 1